MNQETRKEREAKGRRAERWAGWFFRAKGYRVLARRYRSPVGEIDLIVRRGNALVFVEVKAHKTLVRAIEAITPKQRQRIVKAAEYYIAENDHLNSCEQRVDALCLVPGRLPVHMHNICPG